MLATIAAATVLAAAAPGACAPKTVAVAFDPRGTVTVTGDGKLLARATAVARKIAPACNTVVSVSPPHTPKPLTRRAAVTCAVRRRLEIEAHPILPSGSQLIVSERGSDTWLFTAVIQPGASKLYVFSDRCKVR